MLGFCHIGSAGCWKAMHFKQVSVKLADLAMVHDSCNHVITDEARVSPNDCTIT